jgi:hypothetical protein
MALCKTCDAGTTNSRLGGPVDQRMAVAFDELALAI